MMGLALAVTLGIFTSGLTLKCASAADMVSATHYAVGCPSRQALARVLMVVQAGRAPKSSEGYPSEDYLSDIFVRLVKADHCVTIRIGDGPFELKSVDDATGYCQINDSVRSVWTRCWAIEK
jgi:hypothetical protein